MGLDLINHVSVVALKSKIVGNKPRRGSSQRLLERQEV